ncbi:hypothetical protein EUTSA_v10013618mg [Eutrema salsugineum]|uniref:F-box domain-containing protein n=1 Tax=Eutrema salsugineum TaxID=72664 RepID=V4KXN7_EUTSA|nr:putative FBD-associated F-box protein At5g56440 [Eutrema salsugineum]ESQ42770.1 hypothetical protein EUTSA_v10013618mg [Eutrema salsugineum]
MDRISLLPDDLILNILFMVPSKDAVTTSLLSKRWRDLWKHVPKLWYTDPYGDSEYWRASRFVDKFLLLHKAPVLETLHLSLSRNCRPTDIEIWIRIAVSRGLQNLEFYQHRPCYTPIRLPRSLCTCESLVTLRLQHAIIVDVPLKICFRSLKLLALIAVDFSRDEIVYRVLSGCPVLEALEMVICSYGKAKTFTIAVPSLQRLLVVDTTSYAQVPGDVVGIVIKVPSLKTLTIANRLNWVCPVVNMPKLEKATIKLPYGDAKKLLGCLTSAKHLSLCVKNSPVDPYRIGVFDQLVSLTLCACSLDWFRLILRQTPKLRVLRFQLQVKFLSFLHNFQRCYSSIGDVQTRWERPSSVPQCLISSLETVEWIDYRGREAERKVVMYLLENSGQLKTMAIRPLNSTILEERHKMLQELSSTPRISSKCRLSFT